MGTVIQIEKKYNEDNSKFRSKIIDASEGSIMIDYPTDNETGRTVYLMDGTELTVTFTDEEKMSYVFQTEVRGRIVRGVPMLKLSYQGTDKLEKIQRREYVRISAMIDVAVKTEAGTFQLVTEDVSAGGIALNISETPCIDEDDIVQLLIVLPFIQRDIKYVHAEGKVIRIWNDKNKTIASLEFLDISPADRQQIIQFCFERQLKMKNK